MTTENFNLCDSFYLALESKYPTIDVETVIPPWERTVLLVWGASGVIDNGGFEFLFECHFEFDPIFENTVTSFNEIGCHQAAGLVTRALSIFPNSLPPLQPHERTLIYQKEPATFRNELNHSFWELSQCGNGEICEKLAIFIRNHG